MEKIWLFSFFPLIFASEIKFLSGDGVPVRFKGLYCSNDPTISSDLVCIGRPVRNKFVKATGGFTILKPTHAIFISITVEMKNSANRFQPTAMNYPRNNFCEIAKNEYYLMVFKKFTESFYPAFMEHFGNLVHPCPYEGRIGVVNLTMERFKVPSFVKSGDHKIIIRISDAENRTYFEVNLLVEAKIRSLINY